MPEPRPDRCQATAANGQPCSAKPRPGRPLCLWHDPEADEKRREISRKGGAARSNAAKARKQLPANVLTASEWQDLVGTVAKGVITGKLSPGVGQAVASLARAHRDLAELGRLEEQVAALEALVGRGRSA